MWNVGFSLLNVYYEHFETALYLYYVQANQIIINEHTFKLFLMSRKQL